MNSRQAGWHKKRNNRIATKKVVQGQHTRPTEAFVKQVPQTPQPPAYHFAGSEMRKAKTRPTRRVKTKSIPNCSSFPYCPLGLPPRHMVGLSKSFRPGIAGIRGQRGRKTTPSTIMTMAEPSLCCFSHDIHRPHFFLVVFQGRLY